jgi:CRP-like cAMP-binding protein
MEQRTTRMTAIEKVIALRGTEPFSACRAEEALRLAAISAEKSFEADQVIFRIDDPSEACYCLVEGSVLLGGPDGAQRLLEAPAAFGLVEILSDRRRGETVTVPPGGAARALAIDAEDLFDLLSNNVEIVRSLFRALLGDRR